MKTFFLGSLIAASTFGLTGCGSAPVGAVASQVAVNAATGGTVRNRHVNRFRSMDCDRLNAEIVGSRRSITNPLVGDGGYSSALTQVAAEKGCPAV